jgi:carboxylesterase type B
MGEQIHLQFWRRSDQGDYVRRTVLHHLEFGRHLCRWGESAGAMSVGLHMIANNGNTEGLFQGAIMQSGAPPPVGDITKGQPYYDKLVNDTGCRSATDTLQCLRGLDYGILKAAVDATPSFLSPQVSDHSGTLVESILTPRFQSLNLAWVPRVDGDFLTDAPTKLMDQGKIANVPFISGMRSHRARTSVVVAYDRQVTVMTKAQFSPWRQPLPLSTYSPQLNKAGSF